MTSVWRVSSGLNSLSLWEREGGAKRRKGEGRVRLYERQPTGTVPRARQLRRDASDPERRLLRALREAFPEHKWRHQSPVGPFYVDILCFAERLAIEVDGDTHADSDSYDATRTRFLQGEGLRVLRFANGDVMENVEGVLSVVAATLSGTGKGSAQ